MATKLNTFYKNNSEGFAPGKYIWQENKLILKNNVLFNYERMTLENGKDKKLMQKLLKSCW